MSKESLSENQQFFRGARVNNVERLKLRALEAQISRAIPEHRRVIVNADAMAIAQAHPKKGWAKRYLRAHGLPINGSAS